MSYFPRQALVLGFRAKDASNGAVQSFLTKGLVTVPSGCMSCTGVHVLRGYAYVGLHRQSVQALMRICIDESVLAGSVCVSIYACVCQCVPVCTCVSVGGLHVCGCMCIQLCMSISYVPGSISARVLCCWSVHLYLCMCLEHMWYVFLCVCF